MHAVDRCWLVAEAFGRGRRRRNSAWPSRDEARTWAGEQLADLPRPWLAVGAGSRWPTKRWPPEHFAALARQAQDRFGGTVVFVGGGDETALADAVAARLTGPVCNLAGRTTLPQLAAVLSGADVMLANDTGPLHLAAALGRPVVAPYTCTRVRADRALRRAESAAVESRVWCQGSRLKRCGRMECMTELTPDRLWPRLEEVLTDMAEPTPLRLILASGSWGRRELLTQAGYPSRSCRPTWTSRKRASPTRGRSRRRWPG